MRLQRILWLTIGSVALMLVATLLACGGESATDTSTTPPPAEPTIAPTAEAGEPTTGPTATSEPATTLLPSVTTSPAPSSTLHPSATAHKRPVRNATRIRRNLQITAVLNYALLTPTPSLRRSRRIPQTRSPATDRDALVALYGTGKRWTSLWNWLSDKPLGHPDAVTTIGSLARHHCRRCRLSGNQAGMQRNDLSADLPPELSATWEHLERLSLESNPLDREQYHPSWGA